MVPVSSEGRAPGKPATPLSVAERDKVLYRWNDTHAEFPNLCTRTLFEQQVERTPHATAVVFGKRSLSYRELNQRANQVAHYLRQHGVGQESLVGVSLKRSPELVVALIAVWKAGAAYVPLDPTYPAARLAFMADDAAIRMLLTDSACRPLFPSIAHRALCLDTDEAAFADCPQSNPMADVSPTSLAYVMYTSGSTGQPKGAMILHRGLVNYLWWAIGAYGVKEGDSVPVTARSRSTLRSPVSIRSFSRVGTPSSCPRTLAPKNSWQLSDAVAVALWSRLRPPTSTS